MILIGITGTIGAGKGTVVDYLMKKKGFVHVGVSDTFLFGEAKKRGLLPDRKARTDIANEFRAKSPTALMEECYKLALPEIAAGKNIVLEPQHTAAEVEFIQSKGGIEFAVDAKLETRYERIKARASEKDRVSFEEFEKEQSKQMRSDDPNKNNLAAAIAKADFVFQNDATEKELFGEIEKVLKNISKQ